MRKMVVGFLVVMALMTCVINWEAAAADTEKAPRDNPLLSIGKIGPDAVNLRVWTDLPVKEPVKPGQQVAISFKANRNCCVVAANISSRGDVAIMFPNRETPNNCIEANREYTLFGKDSELKLVFGKDVSEARVVFYVSMRPIDLTPFKPAEGKAVITIPAAATREQGIFRDKIEGIAKEKGFNREILTISAGETQPMGLRLMGPPPRPRPPGKEASSEPPGVVTGTRGRVDQPQEETK